MCFASQRLALFRHLNFQKWSEHGVLCAFWLGNVPHATTACTFSTSQLPKVVRTWCILYILTWKCASRHNDVQLFICHVTTWLRTCRFSDPTFRPSRATNHWRNTVFRDFPTFSRSYLFARLDLLSSDSFSSLIFSLLLFSSLTLPTSAFPSVHIVGSLTSKLLSNIFYFQAAMSFLCLMLWDAVGVSSLPHGTATPRFHTTSEAPWRARQGCKTPAPMAPSRCCIGWSPLHRCQWQTWHPVSVPVPGRAKGWDCAPEIQTYSNNEIEKWGQLKMTHNWCFLCSRHDIIASAHLVGDSESIVLRHIICAAWAVWHTL